VRHGSVRLSLLLFSISHGHGGIVSVGHCCRTYPEGIIGLSLGFQPLLTRRRPAPKVAAETEAPEHASDQESLTPLRHPQPATRVQFRLGAVLQHSTTPSLRVAGFEDEDDDEYENDAPCEGAS
jgi:hypothetical protein